MAMTATRDVLIVLLGSALVRMEADNLTVGQLADLLIKLLDREGYEIRRRHNEARSMKTYIGKRIDGRCIVRVSEPGKRLRPLRPRLDLYNHSPTGFEWGYGGSGPAQLALALLADVLDDDELAVRLHQEFKQKFIAWLPRDLPWTMTEQDIRNWTSNE
jgi:Family of unknown function (DUF6166)